MRPETHFSCIVNEQILFFLNKESGVLSAGLNNDILDCPYILLGDSTGCQSRKRRRCKNFVSIEALRYQFCKSRTGRDGYEIGCGGRRPDALENVARCARGDIANFIIVVVSKVVDSEAECKRACRIFGRREDLFETLTDPVKSLSGS